MHHGLTQAIVLFSVFISNGQAFTVHQNLLDEVEHPERIPKSRLMDMEIRSDSWMWKHRRHLDELRQALNFLGKFGYLPMEIETTAESLANALGDYQVSVGLEATGDIDAKTILSMRKPRCGNPDINDPGNEMVSPLFKVKLKPRPTSPSIGDIFLRRKRYTQESRWDTLDDNGNLSLTWFAPVDKMPANVPQSDVLDMIKRAFAKWSAAVDTERPMSNIIPMTMTFVEADNEADAQIVITWEPRVHGDGHAFDGANKGDNVVAHTIYPGGRGAIRGDIHLDIGDTWVTGAMNMKGELLDYVITHEIGHALGLGHSNVADAIMSPAYKELRMPDIVLNTDDVCAVTHAYVGASEACLRHFFMYELSPRTTQVPSNRGRSSRLGNQLHVSHSVRRGTASGARTSRSEKHNKNIYIAECSVSNNVRDMIAITLAENLGMDDEDITYQSKATCEFANDLADYVNTLPEYNVVRTASFHRSTNHAWAAPITHRARRKRSTRVDAASTMSNRQFFDIALDTVLRQRDV